jgi:hypothetical protein
MSKSKLLSKNTASISIKDVIGKGKDKSGFILSAKYHVNKLKSLNPYVKKKGVYVPAKSNEYEIAEYLNDIQVKHINNLLIGIDLIKMEIENIKNTENYGKPKKQRKQLMIPLARNSERISKFPFIKSLKN